LTYTPMQQRLGLIETIHKRTTRDYLGERVIGMNKADCAKVAKRFDFEYWDGDRKYGYGGYYYDGRWKELADSLAVFYGLKSHHRVLDVGCGKGYLLYDLSQAVNGLEVRGVDLSDYALEHAKEEVKASLVRGNAVKLPFADGEFDLVISINTLHNLTLPSLEASLREIERVSKNKKYIVLDSYATEEQKVNLLYWQLTCECFYTPDEWGWIFEKCGYKGDYDFIFYD